MRSKGLKGLVGRGQAKCIPEQKFIVHERVMVNNLILY